MSLPVNRDERHYTAFILPDLIKGYNFNNLNKFLKLIGIPEKFIKQDYKLEEIELLPEYSLNKVRKNREFRDAISGKTLYVPDLIILVRVDTEKFLTVLEGKVFSYVDNNSFREQLNNQKNFINVLCQVEKIPESNIRHVGILMNPLKDFCVEQNELLINWKEILDMYPEQQGQYCYEYLKKAIEMKETLISNNKDTYRKNCTQVWKLHDIIDYYLKGKDYSDFIVGSQYGLNRLKEKVFSGQIDLDKKDFEVNLDKNKPINRNWYNVRELIDFLNNYDGFNSIIPIYPM